MCVPRAKRGGEYSFQHTSISVGFFLFTDILRLRLFIPSSIKLFVTRSILNWSHSNAVLEEVATLFN